MGGAVDQVLAQEWQEHADGLRREIWVRMMIPGEGQRPWYMHDPAACALVGYVFGQASSRN